MIKPDYDESKVPVGFHEDTDYFGLFRKYLIKSVLPVPSEVTVIEDTEEFKYVTLLFLLKQKDISFFSFWNPSFLMILLNDLVTWKDSLISDVQKGSVTVPGKLSGKLKKTLERKIAQSNQSARELREVFRQSVPILYQMIWPALSLISCWTDAHAKEQSNKLASFFPKSVDLDQKSFFIRLEF